MIQILSRTATENLWKICCDLKVINILQGIKGGYPKYFCYLCCWNTRDKTVDHYSAKWEKRKPGLRTELGMIANPLIKNIDDILLPPLHIKLGIVKKFIEVVVKDDTEVYAFLKQTFPKLSDQKIKAGKICTG